MEFTDRWEVLRKNPFHGEEGGEGGGEGRGIFLDNIHIYKNC